MTEPDSISTAKPIDPLGFDWHCRKCGRYFAWSLLTHRSDRQHSGYCADCVPKHLKDEQAQKEADEQRRRDFRLTRYTKRTGRAR